MLIFFLFVVVVVPITDLIIDQLFWFLDPYQALGPISSRLANPGKKCQIFKRLKFKVYTLKFFYLSNSYFSSATASHINHEPYIDPTTVH